jgi:predicted dienelactone hydrolase
MIETLPASWQLETMRRLIVVWLVLLAARLSWGAEDPAAWKKAGPFAVDVNRYEWQDASRNREVPVTVYSPKPDKGPYPVIIFSHGLGGSRDGYEYLGRHWASQRFVSVHLQHKGSDTDAWKGSTQPYQDLRSAAMSPMNALNRPKDVSFAIDRLEKLNAADPQWKGRLDLKRIGVAGHSFGAYTALASVGQVPRLADPRIRAAIPMSAPVTDRPGANYEEVYAKIKVPCLHMTGTHDDSPIGNTTAPQRRVPFDHIRGCDQYLLILSNAEHMAFSDSKLSAARRNPRHHELILQSSTAFWNAYLKDDRAAKEWFTAGGFAKALGADGTFEVKSR